MKIAALVAAFLVGVCAGFSLGVWLLIDPPPREGVKYRMSDFAKKPPVTRVNEYGREPKQWEFRCAGGPKDCGDTPATPVPEPGTLWLVAGGLAAMGLRRWT
jgi:hypothetical protein